MANNKKRRADTAVRTVIAAGATFDELPGRLSIFAGVFWERARADGDLLGSDLYDYKLSGLAVMVRELRLTRKFEGTDVSGQFFNWLRAEAPWLFQKISQGRMSMRQTVDLYAFDAHRLVRFLKINAPADFPTDAWVREHNLISTVLGESGLGLGPEARKAQSEVLKKVLTAHYGYDKDPEYSSLTNFGAVIEVSRQLHLFD